MTPLDRTRTLIDLILSTGSTFTPATADSLSVTHVHPPAAAQRGSASPHSGVFAHLESKERQRVREQQERQQGVRQFGLFAGSGLHGGGEGVEPKRVLTASEFRRMARELFALSQTRSRSASNGNHQPRGSRAGFPRHTVFYAEEEMQLQVTFVRELTAEVQASRANERNAKYRYISHPDERSLGIYTESRRQLLDPRSVAGALEQLEFPDAEENRKESSSASTRVLDRHGGHRYCSTVLRLSRGDVLLLDNLLVSWRPILRRTLGGYVEGLDIAHDKELGGLNEQGWPKDLPRFHAVHGDYLPVTFSSGGDYDQYNRGLASSGDASGRQVRFEPAASPAVNHSLDAIRYKPLPSWAQYRCPSLTSAEHAHDGHAHSQFDHHDDHGQGVLGHSHSHSDHDHRDDFPPLPARGNERHFFQSFREKARYSRTTDTTAPRSMNYLLPYENPHTPMNSLERDIELKRDMVSAHKLMHKYNLADLTWNHISCRSYAQPNRYFVTSGDRMFWEFQSADSGNPGVLGSPGRDPNCSPTGADVDPNFGGDLPWGDKGVNKTANTIHSAIYQLRPEIRAIVHSHSPAIIAVSCLEGGLKIYDQQGGGHLGRIGYYDWAGISDDSSETMEIMRGLVHGERGLRGAGGIANVGPDGEPTEALLNTLIMHHHGGITMGRTLKEAWVSMYYLDQLCRTYLTLLSASSGEAGSTAEKPRIMIPETGVAEQNANWFKDPKYSFGTNEWTPLRRLVARERE